MVIQTDQEKTAIEKYNLLYLQILKGGGVPCHRQPQREAQCRSGGRRSREKVAKSLYCGFHREKLSQQV